jgi:hypothetical protein
VIARSRSTVIAAAAAVLCQTSPARAQEEGWGLTIGATSTVLDGDYVTSRGDATWGFTGGVFGERRMGGNLAVYVGVEYAQRGGQGQTGATTERTPFELDLDYVDIPLLVEIRLPLGEMWGLVVYGGVEADFNVKCRATFGDGATQPCKETELGGAKTGWGAPAGGGLSYRVGDGDAVVFEVRHSWGLSNAVADQELRYRGWSFQLRLARAL